MSIFYLTGEQMEKLCAIEKRLHSGSDAMRDEGHKLWLIVNTVREYQEVVDVRAVEDGPVDWPTTNL